MSAGAAAAAKSPFAIDYSSFTVVIDGHAAVSDVSVVLKAVQEANKDYAEPMTKDSAAKEVIMLTKKSEKINGVTAMMDMMLKDLDEGKTTVTATKKDTQDDYESS